MPSPRRFDSLARPGGYDYSISVKWLEFLKEIAPSIKRVGVLRDPALTLGTAQFAAIQAMAPTVGVEVTPIGVRDAGEIESGIGALARISNARLIVIGSALTAVHRHLIIALAAQHKLPAIYYERFQAPGVHRADRCRGGLAGDVARPDRVRVIGILETISPELNSANLDALRRGLRELGYTEGQSIRLEYRSAEGAAARFPALAAELVRLKVDLIVTRGTPAARAAKEATSTIPIVMAAIAEPLDTGMVASLARPGGNVTGLSALFTELAGRRVELMKEVVPGVTRVGFLNNMSNPVIPPQWEETQKAAQSLGIEAELLDVRSKEDIPRAFEKAAHSRIDALIIGIDAVTQQHGALIASLTERQRLPTICGSREYVEAGGLMSYGVSYPDLYRRAAGMVDKIFKGAKPGDLPVEQPTKFELVTNGKTAKAIGLKIPPVVLIRADALIE
jgi:putative ABC transport system substrate-binding protein